MAGADLQKSPVLFIATFTQVPTRPLGAVIGVTFQVASFGKQIAKLFSCAPLFAGRVTPGCKACRKRNRKPAAAGGGQSIGL